MPTLIRLVTVFFLFSMSISASPAPEESSDALIAAVNKYRVEHGLRKVSASTTLNKVAALHVRDLQENRPDAGNCNMHSWSEEGDWSACCYKDIDAEASCMWNKPREISGFRYDSNGYEVAAWLSDSMHVEAAIQLWQQSAGHNAVILNKGAWSTLRWKAIGAAMSENYAVVWFGTRRD